MKLNISLPFRIQLAKRLLPVCENNLDHAQQEIRWLTEYVKLNLSNDPQLSELPKNELDQKENEKLEELVSQRVDLRKPLQYILGTQPFGELDIVTKPPVLIPRWETEEWALKIVDNLNTHIDEFKTQYQRKFKILDICSGSGCIALTFASMLPSGTCEVVGLDNAEHAIALSRLNTSLLSEQLRNPVEFKLLDILNDSSMAKFIEGGAYDMIISNPPYITRDEYRTLSPEVKLWEDCNALVADDDGMLFHKRLAVLAKQLSSKTKIPSIPRLAMEIGGEHQVEPLVNFLKDHQFESVQVWADLAGRDRVIAAQ
ncbi:hypothetical protein K7432_002383 [Basidiobolus ranarum]|uniref:peptide chain release factor N(5)-glutamine methyltransferase n=1 Tax=Basidiobolus ranarum TaxID=34480 RepID=A0ABR2X1P8_9FUNG